MQRSENSILALVLIILIACSNYLIVPTTGSPELKALMEIKKSLDPANKVLMSWNNNGNQCFGFLGVACNEYKKVANISLQGKGLAGIVPEAVAELKCLSGLYLHYNALSGDIPKGIANLTELTDLYLNVNNITGIIPPQIGSMASLQVLELCCNQLTGSIPTEMGLLKKLNVLSLKNNKLTGPIPASLGDLGSLKMLHLSSNQLSGPVPARLLNNSLQVLDVKNNPGLCGNGISTLRACTDFDNMNVNLNISSPLNRAGPSNIPQSASFPITCPRSSNCSKSSSSKLPQIGIVAGVIAVTVALAVVAFIGIVRYRRSKQRVGNKSDISQEDDVSTDRSKDMHSRKNHSPLVALEYPNGWDPTGAALDCNGLGNVSSQQGSKFNLEEVESATQHFSEANLLGKSKFSAVYKGILKDGSVVAIKRINKTSCKTEEDEFLKGLNLLNSMKHENVVGLRGFCGSKARGECFLIYEFAPRGNLSRYLDGEDDSKTTLDWPTRVSIIRGIAKGIQYLHSNEMNKPPIIHQNISVQKVLLDQQLKPLIFDAGLLKLLADDVVYSALKVSAALGYMAPEYVTTGRFTEKSDIYAYGVIIFQLLCGKTKLPGSTRVAAEAGKFEDFIDSKLDGNFSETEANQLTKIALECTNEVPDNRPSIESVVRQLNESSGD